MAFSLMTSGAGLARGARLQRHYRKLGFLAERRNNERLLHVTSRKKDHHFGTCQTSHRELQPGVVSVSTARVDSCRNTGTTKCFFDMRQCTNLKG